MDHYSGRQVAQITCVAGVLAIASAFAFMLAGITWTGCVIDCNAQGGNHLAAVPLGALSVALLVAGPAISWRTFWSHAAAGLATAAVIITLLSAYGCIRIVAAHH